MYNIYIYIIIYIYIYIYIIIYIYNILLGNVMEVNHLTFGVIQGRENFQNVILCLCLSLL